MDALKKAEQAKRQTGSGEADDASVGETVLSLQTHDASGGNPAAPPVDTGPALPELPLELEMLDAQFVAEPRKPRPEATPSDRRMEPAIKGSGATTSPAGPAVRGRQNPASVSAAPATKDAARNVFEAKQQPATKSRFFAIGVAASTLVAALAIGGYFWWQLQPKSGLTLARTPSAPANPPAPGAVRSPPAATSNPPPAASPALVPPAPAPVPSGASAPLPAAGTSPPAQEQQATAATPASAARAVARPANAVAATSGTEPDSPVRITKSPLRVNPALARAYQAYESGDIASAKKDYERVAATDPQNVDALGGLAAIALREGRASDAEHLYQRVLVADPQDANAISALAGLRGHNTPSATESRLKGLTASQPDAAAPYFALGNLFTTQERWHDAQQAYFKAHTLEPANPDILYNLAISLEHLRQNRLAAQYYGMAADAASRRPAGFDAGQASARQRALQP